MNLTKPKRETCRAYIRFVKSKACLVYVKYPGAVCAGPIDPHHVRPVSLGGSDFSAIPLCRTHHDAANNRIEFEHKYHIDCGEAISELHREYQALNLKPSRTRKQGVSLREFRINCDCWRKKHTIPKSKGEITGRCLVFTCPTTNERKEARIA